MADKLGAISDNHGHVARITGAQLTAGAALTLDIKGTATHSHTIALSAAEVKNIGAGKRVARQTTPNNLHYHIVTFN